ncbi:MAG: 50S ribosomal protein L4 [Bacteroidetes bacterium]|nr:MAG: 50S ribosomal protein L4 [Bacteroidota bacterium]
MIIEVINTAGEKTGRTVNLPEDIFGIEPNTHVMYLAVKQHLAARRQGTHKVKTRAEVQGASRKLHKQKGTGGARKGNLRNPLYKGGGTIFGPKPHAYDLKLNRKVKDLARMSALAIKAKGNAIVVLEDVTMAAPKTKEFAGVMKNIGVDSKKALFVYPDYNTNLYLSLRNVPNASGMVLSDINTYDIMNADVMVLTEAAAKIFTELETAEA